MPIKEKGNEIYSFLIKEFKEQFMEGMWTIESFDVLKESVEEGELTFENFTKDEIIYSLNCIKDKVFEGKNISKDLVNWKKLGIKRSEIEEKVEAKFNLTVIDLFNRAFTETDIYPAHSVFVEFDDINENYEIKVEFHKNGYDDVREAYYRFSYDIIERISIDAGDEEEFKCKVEEESENCETKLEETIWAETDINKMDLKEELEKVRLEKKDLEKKLEFVENFIKTNTSTVAGNWLNLHYTAQPAISEYYEYLKELLNDSENKKEDIVTELE